MRPEVTRPVYSPDRNRRCNQPCIDGAIGIYAMWGERLVKGDKYRVDLKGNGFFLEVECRGDGYDPADLNWMDGKDTFMQVWIHLPSRKMHDYWQDALQDVGEAQITHYMIFSHDFKRAGLILGEDIIPWVFPENSSSVKNKVDDGPGTFYNLPYSKFKWIDVATGRLIEPDQRTLSLSLRSVQSMVREFAITSL